jgi:hypothetical protein
MANNPPSGAKEHLFISYAVEDSVFADWLALKLTSEGYRVWYDRLKLLGGESYPEDITVAIKEQSFRVIAILSRASISKPNPRKERTLALNIAKERRIDFLIPINLDGLKAVELDFLVSDLTFISFKENWFSGFCGLMKKLQQISAPKNPELAYSAINGWLITEEQPARRQETIWSNIMPITQIPTKLRKYAATHEIDLKKYDKDWIYSWADQNKGSLWAFGPPAQLPATVSLTMLEEVDISAIATGTADYALKNIVTTLLKQAVENFCYKKGLERHGDFVHFPNTLESGKLSYIRFDGRKTYVKAVGKRSFRVTKQKIAFIEKSRYHLSPEFRCFFDLLGNPMYVIRIRIYWTDLNGCPLEDKIANRRRKSLCKDWWNDKWLARTMAILQWLGNKETQITAFETDSGKILLNSKPTTFPIDVGIEEETLSDEKEDDENTILDESLDTEVGEHGTTE